MAPHSHTHGPINIKNLPITTGIDNGDYLLVESQDHAATSIMDFENFVIGYDNIDFAIPLIDVLTVVSTNSAEWSTTHTTVMSNSARWVGFDPDVYNISCWDSTCATMTANSGAWITTTSTVAANSADWGDAGLTAETDPIFRSHVAYGITSNHQTEWSTAYDRTGWIGINSQADITSCRYGTFECITLGGEKKCEWPTGGNPGAAGTTYSSGWVDQDQNGQVLAKGEKLKFNHGLGTTDIIISVMVAQDSIGTGAAEVNVSHWHAHYHAPFGMHAQEITTDSVTIQIGEFGWLGFGAGGGLDFYNDSHKFIKVIASSSIGGTPSNVGAYSTGWVQTLGGQPVADGSTHTVNHNLGTGDIIVEIWGNTTGSDTGATKVDGVLNATNNGGHGAMVTSIPGDNTCVVQCGAQGFLKYQSTGVPYSPAQTWVDGWIKVVVLATAGGGASKSGTFNTGWASSHGGVPVANGSTHTITHNLGSKDIIAQAWVSESSTGSNPQLLEHSVSGNSLERGYSILDLTNDTCVLQLAADGYLKVNATGNNYQDKPYTGMWIKVVIMSHTGGNSTASKAWGHIDGGNSKGGGGNPGGAPSLKSAFNVSSIEDKGVGDIKVFFESALDSEEYAISLGHNFWDQAQTSVGISYTDQSTGSFHIKTCDTNNQIPLDVYRCSFSVHI